MKAVLILSGGMDSTTLLHYLVKVLHAEVQALSFDYGQRHKKELKYAAKSCRKLRVPHRIIKLTSITPLISNSALTSKSVEIPDGPYQKNNITITAVPNRNMIMLSIAIGYAENLKYNCVAIANHAGDHPIYPDCREEFINAMNLAASLGTYNKIKVYAPFTRLTKGQIAFIGKELGIDYDKETWSCYKGGRVPCNKCATCLERITALKEADSMTELPKHLGIVL